MNENENNNVIENPAEELPAADEPTKEFSDLLKETSSSAESAEEPTKDFVPVSEETAEETEAPKEEPDGEAAAEEENVTGLSIARGLCDAVIAAGKEQFHGGVRPDNIMVLNGTVSLGRPLQHNVGEFTPQELEYMAPELFWDGIRIPAGDVYSIGLVLYSLYNNGRLPFWPAVGAITPNVRASALQKRMSDEPLEMPLNADDQLGSIILRALAFRTEERWTDAEELKLALNLCKDEDSPIEISTAMSGLMNRSNETRDAVSPSRLNLYDDKNTELPVKHNKPKRHKNLSWVWIIILLAFIVGAVILLFSDSGEKKASTAVDPLATEAPVENIFTPVPTNTPAPTPTATPEPSGPRYAVYIEDVSWNEAAARCKELGGKLAVPTTRQEYETISGLCDDAKVVYVWLGASRGEDNKWFTPDGEEVVFEFNYWGENEPSFVDSGDGAAEDYMLLWNVDGRWYANDSRENPLENFGGIYGGKIGFVCQMY